MRVQDFVLVVLLWFPLTTFAIFNGTVTKATEFQHMAQIHVAQYHHWEHVKMCGGSIVSPSVILTSAHCVLNLTKFGKVEDLVVKVIAGEARWGRTTESDSQIRIVKHVIVHESYGRNRPFDANDIAALVLSYPLRFDHAVQAIRVAESGSTFEGVSQFAGFGKNGTTAPLVLLRAQMEIVSGEECAKQVTEYISSLHPMLNSTDKSSPVAEADFNSVMCARGFDGKSAVCQGDSGSGLVCQHGNQAYLCGIASATFANCGEGVHLPAIYADVARLSGWIQDKLSRFNFTCGGPDEFNCGDGRTCVPDAAWCDRIVNCPMGTDETGCDLCPANKYLCTSTLKCIDPAYICDGVHDCPTGDDEISCQNVKFSGQRPSTESVDQQSDCYHLDFIACMQTSLCLFNNRSRECLPHRDLVGLNETMEYFKLKTLQLFAKYPIISFLANFADANQSFTNFLEKFANIIAYALLSIFILSCLGLVWIIILFTKALMYIAFKLGMVPPIEEVQDDEKWKQD